MDSFAYDPGAGLASLDLEISDAQYIQYPDIVEQFVQETRNRAVAAQKLHISSRRKKKGGHHGVPPLPEPPPFPTNFSTIIRSHPPPVPPCLLRGAGKMHNPGPGKVKVMLRICPIEGNHSSFLGIDPRKKQISLTDPAVANGFTTPSQRKAGLAAPKMFAFDSVFSQDDSLAEMCASSVVDILQAVVNGADGCLFCYGHAGVGKTYSMIGVDDSSQNLGMIPCAISWLFRLIEEQKDQTGARFSVRVSAVEVTGKQETLKDLLVDVASQENCAGTAPGMYLREDPISGTQVENQSELRAPSAHKAAYFLDAAIASRTIPEAEEDARHSHLLFTLHVYQYRVDKTVKGPQDTPNVAGGRSRLHLIDLGSCSKSNKDGNSGTTLTELGNVLLALLNGQRHIPHRESKLTTLIRDALSNLSCRTCMVAHVSPNLHAYNETLQVVQLAARIHRLKRRTRSKFSSTSGSSDDSSSCDSSVRLRTRYRTGIRMGVLREDAMYSSSQLSSHSDPDYTSSSEQSCDTVIYMGRNGRLLSDRELTDNEGPPVSLPIRPRQRPAMGISGSRSSGDESDNKMSVQRVGGTLPSRSVHKSLPQTAGISAHSSSMLRKNPQTVSTPFKVSDSDSRTVKPGWSQEPYREKNEQWIDGPRPQQKSEQWIDGPQCQPAAAQRQQKREQWIDGPGSVPKPGERQELWVDGPKEFCTQKPTTTEPPKQSKVKSVKAENYHAQHSSRRIPKPQNPVVAEMVAQKDEAKPVSHHSSDSPGSMTVNVDTSAADEKAEKEAIPVEPSPPVKSFVRDWVEKHSAIASEAAQEKQHKHSKHSSPKRQKSKDDTAAHKKSSHSPDRYVSSAHSSPRLKRLRKNAPPSPHQCSANRTKAWVKSVTPETSESKKHPVNSVQPETDVDSPPVDDEEPPPDYASVVESIESEAKEQELEALSTQPPLADPKKFLTMPTEFDKNSIKSEGRSIKSEGDKLKVKTFDESNLVIMANRASIYEMQMDRTLENTKNSMQKLAINSEDEISWSGSLMKVKDLDSSLEEVGEEVSEEAVESALDPLRGAESKTDEEFTPTDDPKVLHPLSLRKPDGCSNPNLYECEQVKPITEMVAANSEVIVETLEYHCPAEVKALEAIMERSGDGMSPEECPETPDFCTQKPPIHTKASVIPKLNRSSSKDKPAVPPRTTSKLSSPSHSASSKSEQNSPSRSLSSSPTKTPLGSPLKTSSPIKTPKDSKSKLREPASPSTTKSPSKTKSRLPSFTRSKSQPAKQPKESKFSRSASKSPSPSKKDKGKKESKLPVSKSSHSQDSDSGNDSGIVRNNKADKKLLSPYHKITKPRISLHSSSGHGSDASSNLSAIVTQAGSKGSQRTENSSGYESMIRDSEVSGSSSNPDSTSESSIAAKVKEAKEKGKKKAAGTKRSRSAPARASVDSAASSTLSSPVLYPPSPKAWVDTRQLATELSDLDDHLEIKVYNIEDIERLARRRKEEAELEALEIRRERIAQLIQLQDKLKSELGDAKHRLMVHEDSWSYDLHVAEHMDRDDPDYLEALEKETSILEKRVEACKSRIMMVTCFDVNQQ